MYLPFPQMLYLSAFPRNGLEGGDRAALPQPGVPLEPGWQLGGSAMGSPLGHSGWGGRVSVGWSRRCPGVLWSSAGVPLLPCFTWRSGLSLPSCPCGSHCSNLVSLLLVLTPLLRESLLNLPTLFPRSHAASEGNLQILVLVVGFWPSCCDKSTCYHSAGVSKH